MICYHYSNYPQHPRPHELYMCVCVWIIMAEYAAESSAILIPAPVYVAIRPLQIACQKLVAASFHFADASAVSDRGSRCVCAFHSVMAAAYMAMESIWLFGIRAHGYTAGVSAAHCFVRQSKRAANTRIASTTLPYNDSIRSEWCMLTAARSCYVRALRNEVINSTVYLPLLRACLSSTTLNWNTHDTRSVRARARARLCFAIGGRPKLDGNNFNITDSAAHWHAYRRRVEHTRTKQKPFSETLSKM